MTDGASEGGKGRVTAGGCPCSICDLEDASWRHALAPDRSSFRIYGKGHVWGSPVNLCDRCEQLFQAGDDDALVARTARTWHKTAQDVDEGIRQPLRTLRDADLGSSPLADWYPDGVRQLVAEGFVLLENLTGADWVAAQWPEADRRWVTETRPEFADLTDDGLCWLVRSPWPAIPIDEVVDALWQWVFERHPPPEGRITDEDRRQEQLLVRQFFDQDETSILNLLPAGPR